MLGHAARLETSERLKRLLGFLEVKGSQGATTLEICDGVRATNPGRDASELNRSLERIGDARRVKCDYVRESDGGRRIHRYKIVTSGQNELF